MLEKIQKFLENNPILLHQFSAGIAGGIIFKPKFSNKFIGDFAITTSHDELVLIELEPLINLMTKNGRASAHLTHAFGQVNDWLQRVEDHKITTLTDLGINPDQIGKIRGVVIAGRSSGYDKKKLTALKRNDTGRISLLTYDDILSSMDTLIISMERL